MRIFLYVLGIVGLGALFAGAVNGKEKPPVETPPPKPAAKKRGRPAKIKQALPPAREISPDGAPDPKKEPPHA